MKLGFVGPFSDTNFGDWAMLLNDIFDINVKDIVLFTYDKNLESKIGNYLKNFNVEYCYVSTVKTNITISNKPIVEYSESYKILNNVLKLVKNKNFVEKYLRSIDKLVVIGGGYFNKLWCANHRIWKLASIMHIINTANNLNKKIVFLANSFGPYYDFINLFQDFFKKLNNVVYASRDDVYSKVFMRDIVPKNKISVLPDDLYFLNKNLISDTHFSLPNKKYVVLELFCSIEEINNNLKNINKIVSFLTSKNLGVYFLPFDQNYGGNKQYEFIKKNHININAIFCNINSIQLSDFIKIIKNAEFVICNRYHMLLLAIKYNTNVIQIIKEVCGSKEYYINKSYGLLKNLNINNNIVNKFLVDDISAATSSVTTKYDIVCKAQNDFFSLKAESEKPLLNKRIEYINKHII